MAERLSVLNSNVRGLNDGAKRASVRTFLERLSCSVVCLQETKLASLSDAICREIAGPCLDGHAALDADGTRGGILLLWRTDVFSVSSVDCRSFSITANLVPVDGSPSWTITTVYGPHDEPRKQSFLNEIIDIHNSVQGPWLIIGDFNLIKDAKDKNNLNIDRRWMSRFRTALNTSNLIEIPLIGRKYTWSNEQQPPTLVRLDRAFCTADWELRFAAAKLLPQSTRFSDHCPLLLVNDGLVKTGRRFRFEAYWQFVEGFGEVVTQAWGVETGGRSPLAVLDFKLRETKKALKFWSKHHIGDIQKHLCIADELILQFDTAQESRQLSNDEMLLRKNLRSRTLGLAVLLKIKRKQRSRITWLKAGDANTRFFHRKANARHRKNTIHALQSREGIVTDHAAMLDLAREHFDHIIGTRSPASSRFRWESMDLCCPNLSGLEIPFSIEEIRQAVQDMPADKAPGPDGFSGAFFHVCWDTIKDDLQAALNQIYLLDRRGLKRINTSLISLIPKVVGADNLQDFRPISLIHSVMKIFSKILSTRLAPKLEDLIDHCQSAFIKHRCIQENFLYVQNAAQFFHKTKKPSILLKLDLAKAFDSVSWTYLLDMLKARGFGNRWREWIAMILASSTSQVLINGIASEFVIHRRGLRQGDPLSPFLFILAMDPLQRILDLATNAGALSKLPGRRAVIRASLYADDVAIFINPSRRDATTIKYVLALFADVTGLSTNLSKSSALPIRCGGLNLEDILQPLNITVKSFPCKYLGMPLSLQQLRKGDYQQLLDKIDALLAAWKGSLISREGRLVLLKSVLSSLVIYMMTTHIVPTWVLEQIEKKCRAWLWRGEGTCNGGHCRVKWAVVCRPKSLGGLGVHDLTKFGRALRLRWLWQAWKSPHRPWVGSKIPCDAVDRSLFAAATEISLGDGSIANFWKDRWLRGLAPIEMAPSLYAVAIRKNRTVRQALKDDRWLLDLQHGLTQDMLPELINLGSLLDEVQLDESRVDSIQWRFEESGEYSSKSAYLMQFEGAISSDFCSSIWRSWAPGKCKFFMWTATLDRILTADALQRRGWENNYFCQLCFRNLETPWHLITECTWSRKVWSALATMSNSPSLLPSNWNQATTLSDWIQICRMNSPTEKRKGVHSLLLLATWEIWRERNRRIFQHEELSVEALVVRIRDEAALWNMAGANIPFDPG
jgi:mannosylglycoprotein endo-beta-mannosidase